MDFVGSYLKLKTAGKAAKGATKMARKKPILGLPVIAGIGAAVFAATKVFRGGDEEQPAGA